MPEQQNPARGPGGIVPGGAAQPPRTHGHRTATPDAPQLPRQRHVPPSRPPVNSTPPGGRPVTATPPGGRPVSAPRRTPPGGVPAAGRPASDQDGRPTRVFPGAGDARPGAGSTPPPVGNGPSGPGGGSGGDGSGGKGSGGGDATTAAKSPELGFNKIVAGAGAAIVTAVLGSFLGAVGTILGAAFGSIITTVATTLFQRSLERTRAQVTDTTQKVRDRRRSTQARGAAAWQAAAADGGAGVAGPGSQETVRIDPSALGATTVEPSTPRRRWRMRRLSRKSLIISAVTALLAFGLAMFLVTGIEWVKGSTITGGNSGTSIGNVANGTSTQQQDRSDQDANSGTSTSESSTSTSESTTSSADPSTSSQENGNGNSGSTSTSNPLGGLNNIIPTQGNESGQRQSAPDNGNSGGGANSSN